ncbi:MAG TPA: glycosyl transferase family 1, partial [Candidatus Hydrogenedentes bacterium]|nr:glycosyl transferase family 1 [Candidatus Hydrogenedentota bacterium]
RFKKPATKFMALTLDKKRAELPPLNLAHLRRLTDDTGILQHATYSVPNYDEGYTTDDNSRALILAILLEETADPEAAATRELASRYLAFLQHAFNVKTGRFRNFFSFNRHWLEEIGSEDCHGRALHALGVVSGRSKHHDLRGLAVRLFDEALPAVPQFRSPRAWAFTLLGIHEYLRRFYGHRGAQDVRKELADRLLDRYRQARSEMWHWFEDDLAYVNAVLPHALLLCGQWLGRDDMSTAALESLEWLTETQRMGEDHFVPIGCDGFYRRGGERARFDQQPIEAAVTVAGCLQAYRTTGDERWFKEARLAFDWFLGRNDLGALLYNGSTGGCYDGLASDRVNQNQGAESTLAFLLSLVEMSLAEHVIAEPETQPEKQGDE